MARAHRIGQKRHVQIFRLVTKGTYEAEMFLRASKKLGLDHALLTNLEIGRGALEESEKEDINKLLKLGAYGVFDDDDSAANKFAQEDIDEILRTRAKTIAVTKEQRGEEEGETEGEASASPPAAAATASASQSTTSIIQQRLNYQKMTFSSDSNPTAAIDVNDPKFWERV